MRLGKLVAVGFAGTIAVGALATVSSASSTLAWSTDPTVLTGESGSFAFPLIGQLINDATSTLAPEQAGDIDFDVDRARNDFTSLNADFAVTEYPLTPAQQAAAATAGITYTYVPFAAIPVDIGVDLLSNSSRDAATSPSDFFQDLQFTPAQLLYLFTGVGADSKQWNDNPFVALSSASSAAQCAVDQLLPICTSLPVAITGLLSNSLEITSILPKLPSATVTALENFFAGDSSISSAWSTWISEEPNQQPNPYNELWPVDRGTGNDQNVLDTLIPFDPHTALPSDTLSGFQSANGSVAPLPSDWIYPASTLGGFQVPTAELENASGDFVAGSPASAQAALSYATVDPTTNLVTFPANNPNPAAYPLVQMSYLVVATQGMSSAKDVAMARLIQFMLGSTGVADITAAGAAPITEGADPQLYNADEAVANELLVASGTVAASSTATTSTTVTTSTTATTPDATTSTTPATTNPTSSTMPSAPTAAVPAGYTDEISQIFSSAGGTEVDANGIARVTVDVPAAESVAPLQVTTSFGGAAGLEAGLPTGSEPVVSLSIALDENGQPLKATLSKPLSVTVASLRIGNGAKVYVYDTTTKQFHPASAKYDVSGLKTGQGSVSFAVSGDPEIAVVEPLSKVASATASATPTTVPASGTGSNEPTTKTASPGSATSSSGTLAFTGFNPLPLALGGFLLIFGAEALRRRARSQGRMTSTRGDER